VAQFLETARGECVPTVAPQLIGLTERAAVREVRAAGFRVDLGEYPLSGESAYVVDQEPLRGTSICKGWIVRFVPQYSPGRSSTSTLVLGAIGGIAFLAAVIIGGRRLRKSRLG
jgi:beta-lactam-binding protein with PASTA domain